MDFPSLMPQNYTGFVPAHPAAATPGATTAQPTDSLHGNKGGFIAAVGARVMAIVAWLEENHWKRTLRAREAYLAQAQNIADLENRMREIEHDEVLRARLLP